jgi:IS30 family transposase
LRDYVQVGLGNQWSPEQISQRIREDHPDDHDMRVSHETIYQAIYVQARGGLKREVEKALRTGRATRKPRVKTDQRNSRFKDPMVMISDRPEEVDSRTVPGHWEGDLIMGARNQSAIVTIVERAKRFVLLGRLPNGHSAAEVSNVVIDLMNKLPAHLRGSLTWDQGVEMAQHVKISASTDMDVYFCDPHSPWQRGSNENMNGLLRQYFPKGTDLSIYSDEDLEFVAQQLNRRPRKTLNWRTPAEALSEALVLAAS